MSWPTRITAARNAPRAVKPMPKPTITGVSTASRAGVASSRSEAAVQMSITGPWSGCFSPDMILPSANWRRTSCTTTPAVRDTALMARAEKRNGTAPPMSRPMKTFGSATLIGSRSNTPRLVAWALSTISRGRISSTAVSMKLAKIATEAITAEPMAKPLVTALVVLPTASRLTMIRSGSPWNSPDISAMPAALSDTGPKVSSDTITPVVASMPMPLRATR